MKNICFTVTIPYFTVLKPNNAYKLIFLTTSNKIDSHCSLNLIDFSFPNQLFITASSTDRMVTDGSYTIASSTSYSWTEIISLGNQDKLQLITKIAFTADSFDKHPLIWMAFCCLIVMEIQFGQFGKRYILTAVRYCSLLKSR